MSSHLPIQAALVVVKTVTLILGGLITYFSTRAYQRTNARSLGALAIGFGFVTVGSFFAGVADVVFQTRLEMGLLIESILIAIGFGVIVYSLYVGEL